MLATFISTAALALTANALLVPSHVDSNDFAIADKEFWDGAAPIMANEAKKSINLGCISCPIAVGKVDGQPGRWINGANSELQMEFTVEGKELKLNGVPFYPPSPKTLSQPMSVKQVLATVDKNAVEDLFDGLIKISATVDIHPQVEVLSLKPSEVGKGKNPFASTEMRRLSIDVIGLADQVIHVDTVDVRFSEHNGELELFGVNTTPYEKHATSEGDACTTIFCRIRVFIATKLAAFRQTASKKFGSLSKGCKGAMRKIGPGSHGHGNDHHRGPISSADGHMPTDFAHHGPPRLHGGIPKFSGDATLAPGGKNHPHGPFPPGGERMHHHGHHMHHGKGHIRHAIAHFARQIMIPILIGIAAGLAVSGLGMMMCQIVVLLYLRFQRRSGKHAYQTVGQADTSMEKGELEVEGPPMYEDVCTETVEVGDEKKEEA